MRKDVRLGNSECGGEIANMYHHDGAEANAHTPTQVHQAQTKQNDSFSPCLSPSVWLTHTNALFPFHQVSADFIGEYVALIMIHEHRQKYRV